METINKLMCMLIVLGGALFLSPDASAISQKDLQVAARTFGFIKGMPKGELSISVIHDPANADSKAEADAIHALLSGGMKVGKHMLKSSLVTVADIGSMSSDVAFVTQGLASSYDTIFSASSGKKILTLTTDFGCIAAKKCVMGVVSSPKVRIEVSKSAAAASDLKFAAALKLLVKEKD